MCCVSFAHNVAAKGHYVALVSTTVETKNPENELKPGLDLLGPINERYATNLYREVSTAHTHSFKCSIIPTTLYWIELIIW